MKSFKMVLLSSTLMLSSAFGTDDALAQLAETRIRLYAAIESANNVMSRDPATYATASHSAAALAEDFLSKAQAAEESLANAMAPMVLLSSTLMLSSAFGADDALARLAETHIRLYAAIESANNVMSRDPATYAVASRSPAALAEDFLSKAQAAEESLADARAPIEHLKLNFNKQQQH